MRFLPSPSIFYLPFRSSMNIYLLLSNTSQFIQAQLLKAGLPPTVSVFCHCRIFRFVVFDFRTPYLCARLARVSMTGHCTRHPPLNGSIFRTSTINRTKACYWHCMTLVCRHYSNESITGSLPSKPRKKKQIEKATFYNKS